MHHSWFVIVNPKAGQKRFSSQWLKAQQLLKNHAITYTAVFTEYSTHEVLLVDKAIAEGYRNIISFGGDGTLHHVVNGIMQQRYVNTFDITLGVIPIGTGNDWIKTYHIPKSIAKAIEIIAAKHTVLQDVGKITTGDKITYFNNLAGIGYDGYVVSKLKKLKRLGSISYLISGLYGLIFYKYPVLEVQYGTTILEIKSLMINIGICRYSGGGMQLTKNPDPKDGLFDITIVPRITLFRLLYSLQKLYTGTIVNHFGVINSKENKLSIRTKDNSTPFIQADGELIGSSILEAEVIPKALCIVIP